MAWQAFIGQVDRTGSLVTVLVILSDGVEKTQQKYSVVPTQGFDGVAWLATQVRATVASLTPAKGADAMFVVGAEIDLNEPPPIDPIDPDPERTAFLVDYSRFVRLKAFIDAGVRDPDKVSADLLASLRAAYQERFAG